MDWRQNRRPIRSGYDETPGVVRFWEKVDRTGGPDSCWPWTGAAPKHRGGYGLFQSNQKPKGSHRVAWEFANGPIPPGMQVLHRCDNPPCCNPAHLWIGTPQDNMSDKMNKGRGRFPGRKDHRARRTGVPATQRHNEAER